jgi:hypothetical protein
MSWDMKLMISKIKEKDNINIYLNVIAIPNGKNKPFVS